jgi:GNAT superfamily N-acetyltransferase
VHHRTWTGATLRSFGTGTRRQRELETIKHVVNGQPTVPRTHVGNLVHFVYAVTQYVRRGRTPSVPTGCAYVYTEDSGYFTECTAIANDVRAEWAQGAPSAASGSASGSAPRGLFLVAVAIHRDWRSRGKRAANAPRLGQKLVRAVVRAAATDRAVTRPAFVYLTVETNNPAAVRCYERKGFRTVLTSLGKRRVYPIVEAGGTRDAYAMWTPVGHHRPPPPAATLHAAPNTHSSALHASAEPSKNIASHG